MVVGTVRGGTSRLTVPSLKDHVLPGGRLPDETAATLPRCPFLTLGGIAGEDLDWIPDAGGREAPAGVGLGRDRDCPVCQGLGRED